MNNTNAQERLEILFNTVDALKPDLMAGHHQNWYLSEGALYRDEKPMMSCKSFSIECKNGFYVYRIELDTGEQVRGFVPILYPEPLDTMGE